MKYTQEERLDIGRRIYEGEMTHYQAAEVYGISDQTARDYITMPESLKTCLKEYIAKCYDIQPGDRLFPHTKSFLGHEMEYGCEASGVKRIRIHDLRHSHAAALIEMNVAPKLLQERLGHERIQTTLDTYGHLYPNKQAEVAKQLDDFMSKS